MRVNTILLVFVVLVLTFISSVGSEHTSDTSEVSDDLASSRLLKKKNDVHDVNPIPIIEGSVLHDEKHVHPVGKGELYAYEFIILYAALNNL